jgi:hypothetical protein
MPKVVPFVTSTVPCSTMLVAVGRSPLVTKSSVSFESEGTPLETSCAPPVPEELSQPRGELVGGLPQGQAITPPVPAWHRSVPGETLPRSRAKTS